MTDAAYSCFQEIFESTGYSGMIPLAHIFLALFLSEVKSGFSYETILLPACVCLCVPIKLLKQLTDFH
jgi:hypothetical protein